MALVRGEVGAVIEAATRLERYVEAQFPDGVRVERGVISAEEVLR